MKLWRICLAMGLLGVANFVTFWAALTFKEPVVQVFFFFLALLGEMIALSLAQDDGRIRGVSNAE